MKAIDIFLKKRDKRYKDKQEVENTGNVIHKVKIDFGEEKSQD